MEAIKKIVNLTGFSHKEKNRLSSERVIKLLFELSMACLALLIIRVWKTGGFGYVFLVWNLFLAWVPFLVSKYMLDKFSWKSRLLLNLFAIAVWMAFLPNAPYILTDLFHLHQSAKIPQWFDLILILSYALTGMILFYISFLEFEQKVYPALPYKYIRWIRMLLFLAVGYGLYLGRFLRFNSWNVLSAPGELFRGIYHSVFSQNMVKETLSITLFFSVFLYFGYKLFFLFTDHKITQSHEDNTH